MSERVVRGRTIRGTIRRRLLVNALVDPDEAASHLPAGLRPHKVAGGTLVGCCLLDIDSIWPALLPLRRAVEVTRTKVHAPRLAPIEARA